MIDVKNLKKSFGDVHVLKGITTHVNKGECICIIGPSGSGKSTFLRCLNLLEKPEEGEITVNGQQLLDPKLDVDKFRENVGMVFQHFNLFPNMTVLKNITLAPVRLGKWNVAEADQKARALLKRVGLEEKADVYPGKLSGGQKQRVAIARALAMNPQVLLFDEPTSALDPEMVGEVLEVMKELAKEGMTMIIVTHEMEVIRSVCDKMSIIENGEIKISGDTQEIFLMNPEPLQNVTGKKRIQLSEDKTVLKISFTSQEDTAVLSYMPQDLKTGFSILSADIDNYNEKTTGNVFISFKAENKALIMNYLLEKKIMFSEIFDKEGDE